MKITKAIWALMPANIQAEFKAVIPQGKTEADAEEYDNGEENAATLKNALDHERAEKVRIAQERDALKLKETEAERIAREAREKAIRDGGDSAAIEKMYKDKIAADKKLADDALAASRKEIERLSLETEVSRIANLFTIPEVMKPVIRQQLRCELDSNGQSFVRVLDANGNPTANSLTEFETILLAKPEYKSIIPSSNGSGSGATKPNGSGSGATLTKISDFKNATEESLFANANPVEYQKMLDARKAERGY